MNQLSFPSVVTSEEIKRESTLGGAIGLCAKAAGLAPKEVQDAIKADKGQWSRWESGGEGIVWPKFEALMDACGNDAPLLWMLHRRGYDLSSLRRQETEWQAKLRVAEEKIERLLGERRAERNMLSEVLAGRTANLQRRGET